MDSTSEKQVAPMAEIPSKLSPSESEAGDNHDDNMNHDPPHHGVDSPPYTRRDILGPKEPIFKVSNFPVLVLRFFSFALALADFIVLEVSYTGIYWGNTATLSEAFTGLVFAWHALCLIVAGLSRCSGRSSRPGSSRDSSNGTKTTMAVLSVIVDFLLALSMTAPLVMLEDQVSWWPYHTPIIVLSSLIIVFQVSLCVLGSFVYFKGVRFAVFRVTATGEEPNRQTGWEV